jgi:large subunit ribosomal protein L5
MDFFTTYYERIIKQDLINKFKCKNNKTIPKFVKITLNFGCKNFTIQKFATAMLALEIITFKKSTITHAKTPNVLLKIQKGQPAGCKVILKKKEMYSFITRLNLDILPKLKNFSGFKIKQQSSNFIFQIPNSKITINEFEKHYPLFANLPTLDINIQTNSQNMDEILFLAKSIKLPIIKN